MNCNPSIFAKRAIDTLSNSTDWAADFVRLRMDFFREYQNGYIFSTRVTGADFFENVLDYLSSDRYLSPELGTKLSEYDKNFNAWLKEARGIK